MNNKPDNTPKTDPAGPVARADALTAGEIAALSEEDYQALLAAVQAEHEAVDAAYRWLYTSREYQQQLAERTARQAD